MDNATKWKHTSLIISSEYRKKVLKNLDGNPKMPSKISKELNIDKAHISKTLKELQNKKHFCSSIRKN